MTRLKSFFLGTLFAAGALLVEIAADTLALILLSAPQAEYSFVAFVLFFPLVEEIAKLLSIQKMVRSEQRTAPSYSDLFLLGAGFGLLELFLTPFQEYAASAASIRFALLPFFLHVLTAVLTGWGLFKYRSLRGLWFLAMLPSLALHVFFNFWASAAR